MLRFKTDEVAGEWRDGRLSLRLRAVVRFVDSWVKEQCGFDIVLTSIFRPQTTDSGVHATWRGVDIRTRDWPEGVAETLAREVNQIFRYDVSRPQMKTALVHDVGQGTHLHLQVKAGEGAWG
ncbi:MAG: hypothetical protein FJY67_01870 [Calditrichaeota bacterium]|nr:hypothetical protein [Calditrichota bacterium]